MSVKRGVGVGAGPGVYRFFFVFFFNAVLRLRLGLASTLTLTLTVKQIALQMARSSRGSDDHVKWRSRLQYGRKNSVLN